MALPRSVRSPGYLSLLEMSVAFRPHLTTGFALIAALAEDAHTLLRP